MMEKEEKLNFKLNLNRDERERDIILNEHVIFCDNMKHHRDLAILSLPMGLNSPIESEFRFSYFSFLRCPSENLQVFIV